jgi:hypothetical protein
MSTITEGHELPALDVPLTASVIVAGAIASRDFMPVHHDKGFANAQGAPDIFMNILTTNGYVSRFVTDWAGPEAMVRRIALRFTGRVASVAEADGEQTVVVDVRGATDLGDHVTGQVTLTLPL